MALQSPSSAPLGGAIDAASQTVLVVDDEPVARLGLTYRLKRLGYRVLEAGDGKTGLELLRRERPDLTILDWMMPEMDGPTFCEQVRQDSTIRSSQILMMTGNDQPEQIAEGLARGADDFLSKAAGKQEFTARVVAGLRAANLVRTLEKARDEIHLKQEALERELQSAARYVESLLPAPGRLLPGVEMVHAYQPSLALGGDLFNVVRWGEHALGIYLLDASGHGVSPALRSASFSTFLRGESLLYQVGSNDPGAILTEANKQFPMTEQGEYFTIFFAWLDVLSQTLTYSSAGHDGAFLLHRTGALTWLTQPGLPLGFDPTNTYRSLAVAVEPGDRLFLLSDGLYEAPSPTGELWGKARLGEAVRQRMQLPLDQVISEIIASARQWLQKDQFPDDVAMMGLEMAA